MFSIEFNDNHSRVTSASVTLFSVACFLSRSAFVSVKIIAVVLSNACVNYSGVAERSSGRLALANGPQGSHTHSLLLWIDRQRHRTGQTDRQTDILLGVEQSLLVNNLLIHLRRLYNHSEARPVVNHAINEWRHHSASLT